MFVKDLQMGRLLDFYGGLLSGHKRDVTDLYYNEDLSLSEIAENIGISRQGVRDLIKKSEEELVFFEAQLGLVQKSLKAEQLIVHIQEKTDSPEILADCNTLLTLTEPFSTQK